jgi:hypothetical protein
MTTMTKMIGAASLLALVSTQASALHYDQRRIPLQDTSSVSDLEAQTYQGFSDFRDAVSEGLNVDVAQVGDVIWTVGVEDPFANHPTLANNVISTVFELRPALGADAFTDDEVSQLEDLLQAGKVGTYVGMFADEDDPASYDVEVYQSYYDDQAQQYAVMDRTYADKIHLFADELGLSADQIDALMITVTPSQFIRDWDILPESGEESFDDEEIEYLKSALESAFGEAFTGLTNDDTDPGALDAQIIDTYDAGNNGDPKYGTGSNTILYFPTA